MMLISHWIDKTLYLADSKLWDMNIQFLISDWKYSKGFVNDEMIKGHLPPPSNDTVILMCGPPPMINFACQPNLDKLGYSQKSRFAY